MTEDEATTKWCFMTATKEYARSNLSQNCITSGCMAWRETKRAEVINFHPAGPKTMPAEGYCGLAVRR